jgi:hypothetical protein
MRRLEQLGTKTPWPVQNSTFHLRYYRYCYGGSQAVLIAPTELVHSIVICHPGRLTLEKVKAINIPSSWVLAEGKAALPMRTIHLIDRFFRGYDLLQEFA